MESLLSASALDRLSKDKKPYDADRELVAQGVGNMTCSLFGGLPSTSAIVRSSVSFLAGAKTRRASLVHAGMLLGAVYLASVKSPPHPPSIGIAVHPFAPPTHSTSLRCTLPHLISFPKRGPLACIPFRSGAGAVRCVNNGWLSHVGSERDQARPLALPVGDDTRWGDLRDPPRFWRPSMWRGPGFPCLPGPQPPPARGPASPDLDSICRRRSSHTGPRTSGAHLLYFP